MTTMPGRTTTAATIAGVLATGLTSVLAFYVIDLPREWQVTLCLVLMAAVGVVVGVVGRPAAWFRVSLALALSASLVFAVNSIGLDVAQYWLLSLAMFLPGAVVLSAVALGVTHAIVDD